MTPVTLVTGGCGFIGRHLVSALLRETGDVVRILRRGSSVVVDAPDWPAERVQYVTGDLTQPESLAGLCDGVATVFHLAGYAHADDSDRQSGHDLHRRITVEGTRALLDRARAARVRRFIFSSSVKAGGEGGDVVLDEESPDAPGSGYGAAKRAAEQLVLGERERMHVAVLRLPLVYGRGNKGNIPRLIAAIDRRRLPPLPEVQNRRSMIHVDDVVRALQLVGADARALGRLYIVTDGPGYSTREIYEAICRALGRGVPRWAVPAAVFRIMARVGDWGESVLGRAMPFDSHTYAKLLGSACYRSARIERELGFRAVRRLHDGLAEMVEDYRKSAV